jgi:hypothetical protein
MVYQLDQQRVSVTSGAGVLDHAAQVHAGAGSCFAKAFGCTYHQSRCQSHDQDFQHDKEHSWCHTRNRVTCRCRTRYRSLIDVVLMIIPYIDNDNIGIVTPLLACDPARYFDFLTDRIELERLSESDSERHSENQNAMHLATQSGTVSVRRTATETLTDDHFRSSCESSCFGSDSYSGSCFVLCLPLRPAAGFCVAQALHSLRG